MIALWLTMPAAEVEEIRSVGLVALRAVPPELECLPYLEGESDPVVDFPESVVAMELVDMGADREGISISFNGISQGERTILVECYDSSGSRIFLGCGQVQIRAGQSASLQIDMVEDPVTTEPR